MSTPKQALVTGAASGIGLATARLLHGRGWNVVGLDQQPPPSDVDFALVTADVRDEDVTRRAVADGIGVLGGLDALVCCAGISGSSAGDGPVAASGGAAFDAVVSTNLRGAFVVAGAAWTALAAGGGTVITVSSVLGLTGGGGPFRSHAYVASKGGLVALTRALAAEGRSVDVRANCVAPGLVDTPLAGRGAHDPHVRAYVADRQQLVGGLLTADDVAGTIGFLCSAEAQTITGQVLAVDAGWMLDPSDTKAKPELEP